MRQINFVTISVLITILTLLSGCGSDTATGSFVIQEKPCINQCMEACENDNSCLSTCLNDHCSLEKEEGGISEVTSHSIKSKTN